MLITLSKTFEGNTQIDNVFYAKVSNHKMPHLASNSHKVREETNRRYIHLQKYPKPNTLAHFTPSKDLREYISLQQLCFPIIYSTKAITIPVTALTLNPSH
jgi:hypothetical protein